MIFTTIILLAICQSQADYWEVDYLTPPQGEVLEVGEVHLGTKLLLG